MSNNVIISVDRELDNVELDGQYTYPAYITIGLEKATDFYVKIEFLPLSEADLEQVLALSKHIKPIPFTSDLIKKEQYNISHIVITDMATDNESSMLWECLSEEPGSGA